MQGLWQTRERVYEDQVIVFTVIDFRSKTPLEILRDLERLKGRLMKKLQQLDLLITVQEMLAI